jgi:hypothetical protein
MEIERLYICHSFKKIIFGGKGSKQETGKGKGVRDHSKIMFRICISNNRQFLPLG